ncbi:putative Alpha/beta hydrolase fold-containing protein [Streptomyces viridochromogenes Tue57]|uniref:Putative Alpha/beta hydrolase fold-containing protein n=1 Tax=Streptomyces viridochromogenes Tue57 TaxID=1160705 RepID=L8P3X1_STRVR|nr:putative Alpha/beta hydrolase fold-containing protein [Streptomyces viridochromogenes Tue57]
MKALLPSFRRCAEHTACHLLDLPGFAARQRATPAPPLVGPLADTVTNWLASVPDSQVVLVGHSTGAQVALRAAARNPDRVRALVLLGMTFPPHLRRAAPLLRAVTRTAVREPVGLLGALVPDYLRAGPLRLTRYLDSALRDHPEDALSRLCCPVVLAAGAHDPLAPPGWIEHAARQAPDGRSVTLPGAHGFPYSAPESTAALVLRAAAPCEC